MNVYARLDVIFASSKLFVMKEMSQSRVREISMISCLIRIRPLSLFNW